MALTKPNKDTFNIACENSRPSSLPARVAFRARETPLGPGAKKDGCFRRLHSIDLRVNSPGQQLHLNHVVTSSLKNISATDMQLIPLELVWLKQEKHISLKGVKPLNRMV